MAPIVAPPPSIATLPPPAAELEGLAICPSCHTAAQSITNLAVSQGAEWHCTRCDQRWDARRLAAVTAYNVWVADREERATIAQRQAGGAL